MYLPPEEQDIAEGMPYDAGPTFQTQATPAFSKGGVKFDQKQPSADKTITRSKSISSSYEVSPVKTKKYDEPVTKTLEKQIQIEREHLEVQMIAY